MAVSSSKSYLLSATQLIAKRQGATPSSKASTVSKKGKGRPRGSKNKAYQAPESLSYQVLRRALQGVCLLLNKCVLNKNIKYLVLDGFYGHLHYLKLAQTQKLSLISKLKKNSHLILPYTGKQKPRGRPKKLGKKLDYQKLPASAKLRLPQGHPLEDKYTQVWTLQVYAKKFKGALLKVVIIQRSHPKTNKVTQTILFSDDLNLDALQMIHYYGLRFQIEFDFRDAKQYFGLAHFKNYKKKQLTTAVNLAFTAKLVSQILLEKYKKELKVKELSILDIKALFKAQMYYEHLFNTSQNTSHDFLNQKDFLKLVKLESIHI